MVSPWRWRQRDAFGLLSGSGAAVRRFDRALHRAHEASGGDKDAGEQQADQHRQAKGQGDRFQ